MMFEDQRSKQIVLVSHCILNQNSISDGTADFKGTFKDVIEILTGCGVGIIQMPCPELLCLGLDRGDINGSRRPVVEENTRIRKELLQQSSTDKINQLIDGLLIQIKDYLKHGFELKGLIGVNRSPSCGVDTTSAENKEITGEGVFIESLLKALNEEGIILNAVGIKTSEIEDSIKKVQKLLI